MTQNVLAKGVQLMLMTTPKTSLDLNVVTQALTETMQVYANRTGLTTEEKVTALTENYKRNILVEGVFSTRTDILGPQLHFKGVSGGLKTEVSIGL